MKRLSIVASLSHPALGHHLGTSLRTGRFCVYTPDPISPVSWRL